MAVIEEDILKSYKRLTPRVIDVWVAVCMGKSNKGIARDLNISENTVEAHLGRLYRELDLERGENSERIMAVLIALGIKD